MLLQSLMLLTMAVKESMLSTLTSFSSALLGDYSLCI